MINIKLVVSAVREQKLKWFGHVQSMPTTRVSTLIKEVGDRGRGRPRRMRENDMEDALRERGLTIWQVISVTTHRKSLVTSYLDTCL